MQIVKNAPQGSDTWKQLREGKRTASESVFVMGLHPGHSRSELLEAKATKTPKQYSSFVEEVVFEAGHQNEAKARPIAENIIGDELFQIVGVNGEYMASYDGATMLNDVLWESKSVNDKLRDFFNSAPPDEISGADLPKMYRVQMEVQLRVCEKAEKCLFTAATFNGGDEPSEFWHCWYERDDALWQEIQKHWAQFDEDLANWKPTEKRVEPVAETPDAFPVPFARLSGELTIEDNLEEFESQVVTMVQAINTDLVTDQHFADAELRVKQLKEGEETLEQIKKQILAGNADLNATIQTIDRIKENLLRKTRLELNPKIESRKKERRAEIVEAGRDEFAATYTRINNEFTVHNVRLTGQCPDFWAVIKGKRSFSMMESAVNDALAQAKIDLNDEAAGIRDNLKAYSELAQDYEFLFKGRLQDMVAMAPDHFSLKVKSEITEYKEAETKKDQERKDRHLKTIEGMNDHWALAKEEAGGEAPSVAALIEHRKFFDAIDTSTMDEYAERAESLKQQALKDINSFIKHGTPPEPMESRPGPKEEYILEQADQDWGANDPLPMSDDLAEVQSEEPASYETQSSYAWERAAKPSQIRIILNTLGNNAVFVGLQDEQGNDLDIKEWEQMENGLSAIVLTAGNFQ